MGSSCRDHHRETLRRLEAHTFLDILHGQSRGSSRPRPRPAALPPGLALRGLTPAPVSYRVYAARSCFAPTNAASSSSTRSFSESFFLALPRMLILHIFANWHHPRAAWRHRLQERDGRSHWKELYAAPLRLSRRMLVMRDRCTPVAKHAGDPRPVRGQGWACPAGLPGLRRRGRASGSPAGIPGRGIVAQPRGLGRCGGPPPRLRSLPGG